MWTNNNLESVVNKLNDMLPGWGSVTNINKNRCLERFRTAQNVVHDIFNNGLGNRGKQLKVLKLKIWELPLDYYRGGELIQPANWTRIQEIVEPKMEKIILDAAKEQGIKLELVADSETGKLELEAA
tara:strand:- start:1024 stop:1404 length:381 start_codon:yes stop_codon:yes gene_type:complete